MDKLLTGFYIKKFLNLATIFKEFNKKAYQANNQSDTFCD